MNDGSLQGPHGLTGPTGAMATNQSTVTNFSGPIGPTGSSQPTNDNIDTSARPAPTHDMAMAKRFLASLDPDAGKIWVPISQAGSQAFRYRSCQP
jgi:hypothetical protein